MIGITAGTTVDEIAPLSSLVLQNVLDAYVEGVMRERRATTGPGEDQA
jgi:hypothetical protein